MQEFIRHLERTVPDKFQIIIRPHPLGRYDYPIASSRKNFSVDTKTPLHSLIVKSEFVVGINSTALLEALCFNKKVYAYGKGLFSSSTAIKKLSINDQFVLEAGTNQESIDALLYNLVFRHQVYSHGKTITLNQVEALSSIIKGSKRENKYGSDLSFICKPYSTIEIYINKAIHWLALTVKYIYSRH